VAATRSTPGKAITPPKEASRDQSIAASGTLPIEPMKVKKATIGATRAFSSTTEGTLSPPPSEMRKLRF
jgi:hypothetical protein